MSKIKRPAQYNAPLKSRKAIIAFLQGHTDYQRSMSTCSPLAWNVKDYGSDLSFDHLVEVFRKSGYYGDDDVWLDSPEYLAAARENYEEVEDDLWNWAIEECQEGVEKDLVQYMNLTSWMDAAEVSDILVIEDGDVVHVFDR
jgi:hypothetical protein